MATGSYAWSTLHTEEMLLRWTSAEPTQYWPWNPGHDKGLRLRRGCQHADKRGAGPENCDSDWRHGSSCRSQSEQSGRHGLGALRYPETLLPEGGKPCFFVHRTLLAS